jgi:DNA-binding response OmpR family regulator
VRILTVEDEPNTARSITSALDQDGFSVDVTSNTAQVTERLRFGVYDLLILDVSLHDRDGLTLCREVRAGGIQVPILMLSSRRRVADRVEGLNAGADDYVTKPFAASELRARIRALGRRNGWASVLRLTVGDLLLDPLTRHVTRGGRQIELTQKEFALLEYLMRHAGQPVARADVAEKVWGVRWDRRTNVIDVFISHLRRKVDSPREPPLVHAVRGIGYLIRPPATTRNSHVSAVRSSAPLRDRESYANTMLGGSDGSAEAVEPIEAERVDSRCRRKKNPL